MINNKNQCDNTFHCQSYGKIAKCSVAKPKGNGSKYCKFATVNDLIIICSNPLARKNPDQINRFNPNYKS